jgi:hypothetical protein
MGDKQEIQGNANAADIVNFTNPIHCDRSFFCPLPVWVFGTILCACTKNTNDDVENTGLCNH